MSQLLWKLYLEDDVEGFRATLEGSNVKARALAHNAAGPTQHGIKIGSPGGDARSFAGTSASYQDVQSPLSTFAGKGKPNEVSLSRADVNRKDGKGMTLLHHAASSRNANATEFGLALITHPLVDLYTQDLENGWTPLHRSFYFGNITIARAILEREAQDVFGEGHSGLSTNAPRLIRIKDREGFGPFDLLTATIQDRTLHDDVDGNFRGSDDGEEEGDNNPSPSQEDGHDGHGSSHLVQAAIELAGDEIFAFGSNKNITLGLGNEDDRQYPERVSLKRPEYVFRWILRERFERRAIAAASASPVYAERVRANLRTSTDPLSMPSVVRSKRLSIQDVQMSKFHSAVLTEDPTSNLHVTGHGPGGRLGTGNEKTQFTYVCIDDFGGSRKKIGAVALGQDHSLAVTSKGELFVWGSNVHGQLGTGLSRTTLNAEEPLQLVPRQIFGPLKKEVIVGVAASRIHSVVHNSNALYTFGKNEGQLGIVDAHAGTLELQTTPRRVAASRFSCGIQSVSAIERATVCLLENHEVHVFANYGIVKLQFPLDGFTNYFLKESIRSTRYDERPNTIVKVTCGGDTICALSSSGEIFAVNVDQRVDPASSTTASTTNPNKIRAALSFPARVWSLKKGHMNARDVGVDQDGSIVLSTEAGSVWRRVKRSNFPNTRPKDDRKSKDFKFSRVPGLTRVIAVRASGSGAYAAVRRDCDVTRTQIAIANEHLWTDIGKLLPFKNIKDLEADLARNPVPVFWSRPNDVPKIVACLAGSKDLEKDIRQILDSRPNEYCSNNDAVVGSTVSDVKIPVHSFIMASRSSVILDALASAHRTGSWDNDAVSITVPDNDKTMFVFKGLDFLTLIELVLYVYTDTFVGFWLRSKHALELAHRYRQVRVEVMRVASRLEMRNLESAARRMAPSAQPSLNLDLEVALSHWSFLDSGDTAIQLADGEQLVHSDLLSRRCPFFEGLFQGRTAGRWLAERRELLQDPAEAVGVDFSHVELGTFRLVLRHLYADTGEELFDEVVTNDLEEFVDVVLDVLSLANELMLDRLSQICQKVLGQHVTVRNVCSLLNAIGPSAIPEFKNTALEYICLNLEAMLTTQLLDELDEDLLCDLDQVVRDNQLSTLPFAKSGRAEALLLETYPELAATLDRDRRTRLDALRLQAKFADYRGAFATSFNVDDDDDPFLRPKPRNRHHANQRSPHLMAGYNTPRDGVAASTGKNSVGSPTTPRAANAPLQDPSTTTLGEPALAVSRTPSKTASALEDNAQAGQVLEEGSQLDRSVNQSSDQPWELRLLPSSKLGIREIMEQASGSRKSGISMGLASEAKDSEAASGSFSARISQKERRKQQQQQRERSTNPMADSPHTDATASSPAASPWQKVSKTRPSVATDPSPADASSTPATKSAQQRAPSTPQLTMRQTVANASSGRKDKGPIGDAPSQVPHQATRTPPTQRSVSTPQMASSHPGRPASSNQPGSSSSKPVEIQSIRHTPKPDAQLSPSFYMHQSMSDIVAAQENEKNTVKEAVAKRSLEEIQQEQEFLSWWDAESRKAMDEEAAASRVSNSKSRGGGARRGRRGPRRGKGKGEGST